MANTRRRHPSDYLLHNEDMDGDSLEFDNAMHLVLAECDSIIADFKLFEPDEYMAQRDIERGISDLELFKVAAREALDIYVNAHATGSDDDAREAVMQAFEDAEDDWRPTIATAAKEQDYSGLAI